MEEDKKIINNIRFCDIDISEDEMHYSSFIDNALLEAEIERAEINDKFQEFAERMSFVTPDCDKLDYALAACSGTLCGILDIFCVGLDPNASIIGKKVDEWTRTMVERFAKKQNCSSLFELEEKYKIPYDQTHLKGYSLTPSNHHFKSLAHNPTFLGLFFSILNQFHNQSTFVIDGEFITIVNEDNKVYLKGNNFVAKLFCGFINWLNHLMSDVSGSSDSKGRGMGVPSPLLCFSNNVITLKTKLGAQASKFDTAVNNLSVKLFTKGYDVRFNTTKRIPVLINEILTRFMYSLKRLFSYFSSSTGEDFSLPKFLKAITPFGNPSIQRMLLVSNGAFCTVNIFDSIIEGVIRGGTPGFVFVFLMRLNVPGLKRFAFSLFGEIIQANERRLLRADYDYWAIRKEIIEDYISVLNRLKNDYGNEFIKSFIGDLQREEIVTEFEKAKTDFEVSSTRLVCAIDNFQNAFSTIDAMPFNQLKKNNKIKMYRINWERTNDAIKRKELHNDSIVYSIDQLITIINRSVINPSQVNTYMLTGISGLIVSSVRLVSLLTPYLARAIVSKKHEKQKKRIKQLSSAIEEKYYKKYKVALFDLHGRIGSIENNELKILSCTEEIKNFGTDYSLMTDDQKKRIDEANELVSSSIRLIVNPIASLKVDYTEKDYDLFILFNSSSRNINMYKECKNFIISYANCFFGLKMHDDDWKLLWEIIKNNPNAICDMGLKNAYVPVPYKLIDGVRIAIKQKNDLLEWMPVLLSAT